MTVALSCSPALRESADQSEQFVYDGRTYELAAYGQLFDPMQDLGLSRGQLFGAYLTTSAEGKARAAQAQSTNPKVVWATLEVEEKSAFVAATAALHCVEVDGGPSRLLTWIASIDEIHGERRFGGGTLSNSEAYRLYVRLSAAGLALLRLEAGTFRNTCNNEMYDYGGNGSTHRDYCVTSGDFDSTAKFDDTPNVRGIQFNFNDKKSDCADVDIDYSAMCHLTRGNSNVLDDCWGANHINAFDFGGTATGRASASSRIRGEAVILNVRHPSVRVFVLTAFAGLSMTAQPAAQRETLPKPVAVKRDQLRSALEGTSDVAQIISREEARPRIVRIVRGYARARGAWQLQAGAVDAMSDGEIGEFVVRRAQQILDCTLLLWSRLNLAEPLDAQPQAMQELLAELPAGESGYRMSSDCVSLVDSAGEPVIVRTSKEAAAIAGYAQAFHKSVASRGSTRGRSQSTRFRDNSAFFETQFSTASAEAVGFAQGLRRAKLDVPENASVFRVSVYGLSFYFLHNPSGSTQLIFVAPFSW